MKMILQWRMTALVISTWNVVDVGQLDLIWLEAFKTLLLKDLGEDMQISREVTADVIVAGILLVGVRLSPVEGEAIVLDLHQPRSVAAEEPEPRQRGSLLPLDRH